MLTLLFGSLAGCDSRVGVYFARCDANDGHKTCTARSIGPSVKFNVMIEAQTVVALGVGGTRRLQHCIVFDRLNWTCSGSDFSDAELMTDGTFVAGPLSVYSGFDEIPWWWWYSLRARAWIAPGKS